jgi:lysophospholipase L1-like esterase
MPLQNSNAQPTAVWRNLLLIGVSLLAGLVLMEIAVRVVVRVFQRPPLVVSEAHAGWAGAPHLVDAVVSLPGNRFRVNTDGSGRRAVRESDGHRSAQSPAIVLVGDSFVFGLTVDDHETFAALLAKQLPDRRIVNLGVTGYGTDQQLIGLERFLRSMRSVNVSDVIVVVFENDFLDVQRRFDPYLGRAKPLFRVVASTLDRGSFKLPVLDRVMDYSRLVWLVRSKLATMRGSPALNADSGAAVVLAGLGAIRRLGESNGARVHVFAHRRTTRLSSVSDSVWSAFLDRSDAIDITQTFRATPEGNPIGPDGAHWNPEGHRRAARIIQDSLRSVLSR